MTNGEKIQQDFKCEVCEPIIEDNIIHVIFADKPDSAIGFDWDWWNAEYKEPTTKNNLGVDLISRADALDCVNWGITFSDVYKKINDLPSVTSQEPKIVPIAEIKYDKDKLKELIDKAVLTVIPQEPRKGHWITTRTLMHDGEYYCDKCKNDSPNNEKWDYCPNCGAEMVEP